jgi:CrcB protein
MQAALLVALGGACGALSRYGAGWLVARAFDTPFPWATWTVNLAGCLLIGVSVPVLAKLDSPAHVYPFLVVGFLGSFTTFSTYSLDTVSLWTGGHLGWALLNAGGSVAAGLLFVWLGQRVGLWLT